MKQSSQSLAQSKCGSETFT